MHSSVGSPRARDRGLVAMALLVAACASSGDAVPPVPIPEPIAVAGPEPLRAAPRAARPGMVTRAAAPTRVATPAPVRAREPLRAAKVRAPAKVRLDSAAMERAITKQFAYQPL